MSALGPMAGPPPQTLPLPPGLAGLGPGGPPGIGPGGPGGPPNGPGGPPGLDPDEAAEHATLSALKRWQALADDPGEHAFVAKLVAQVAQFIAKEQDEVHNAAGLNSVQKSMIRGRI
jgi:hypothetical protein